MFKHKYKIIFDIINEKIGSVSFKISSFLLIIFLARYLSIEEFGIYNAVISFTMLLTYFFSLGAPIAVIRYVSKDPKRTWSYISFFLKILIILYALIVLMTRVCS